MNNEMQQTTMLEESGTVVAIEGDYALIETQRKSACGHCGVGDSCGTSVLSSLFSNKRSRIRLKNHLGLVVGETAVIGINETVLLSTAVLAYLLPLISMIVCTLVGDSLVAGDSGFVFGLAGLFVGMAITNRIMDNRDYQEKEIILLRNASETEVQFERKA